MKIVHGKSVSLATEAFEAARGQPVVLVSGAAVSMLLWPDEFCSRLASLGHPVVRYDARDTGQSTTSGPGAPQYDIVDLSADLIAILDGYDFHSAHIIGISMGGLVSQLTALLHPQRVRSLTLLASQPLGGDVQDLPEPDPSLLTHFATLSDLDWSNRAAVLNFLVELARINAGASHGAAFDAAQARAEAERELDHARDIRSAFNHAQLAGELPQGASLRAITQPTLVLQGSADRIVPPPHGRAIAQQIGGAELVVIDGMSHGVPHAYVPVLVERIGRFLAEVDSQK